MTYSSHVGWVGVVGESLQVTQDTWSKTVGVRWCAQERVHSCVVCGRRRGRLRLARCRVLRTPPPCAEMWCARHRSAVAGASAASTPHARRALRYLGGRAGRRGGGGWVCCVYGAAHQPTCICVVQCLSHTSHSRCWRTLGGISFVICDTVMHAVI